MEICELCFDTAAHLRCLRENERFDPMYDTFICPSCGEDLDDNDDDSDVEEPNLVAQFLQQMRQNSNIRSMNYEAAMMSMSTGRNQTQSLQTQIPNIQTVNSIHSTIMRQRPPVNEEYEVKTAITKNVGAEDPLIAQIRNMMV